MKYVRFLAICAIALFCNLPLWAEDTQVTCDLTIECGNSKPGLKWETNRFGDVIITLMDNANAKNTVFRNADSFITSKWYVMTPNQTEAKNYFTIEHTQGTNTYMLKHIDGTADLTGKILEYLDGNIQWASDEESNAYAKYTMLYTIGQTCATLTKPTISVATDGTVTFDPIDGATSYTARVYLGRDLLHTQEINSGDKLTFKAYLPESTNYDVTLQAYGANNTYSDESTSAIYTTTGDLANLPKTKINLFEIRNDNKDESSAAYLTMLTNKQTSVLTITISDKNGGQSTGTTFRGSNGIDGAGLKYDGKPIGDYFTRSVPGSSDNNADKKTVIVYTPNTTGNVPEFGKKIEFNKHSEGKQIEWYVGLNNPNSPQIQFDYVYGTDLTEPIPAEQKPHDLAIDTNKVLTFTGVDDADSYKAEVYLNGELVWTENKVLPTGKTIAFQAYVTATFKVYVKAIKGGNVTATSAAYDWELTKESGVNPPSEYCAAPFTHVNGNLTSNIILTWETTEDGDVIISIGDGEKTTGTHFRGNGMGDANLTDWKVKSGDNWETETSAITYFTREYVEGSNQFILRLKDDVTLPSPARIYTPKPIEWYSFDDKGFNITPQGGLTYTYGGVCKQLGIVIAEDKDNTATIAMYDGRTSDVTLSRSFEADGANYTLCLPFAMTEEQCLAAFGSNYKLWKLGEAYMKTTDVMYLPFSEVTAIEAGKPYLFCPAIKVENPTIEGVTINAADPASIGNAWAKMTGIYSPYELPEANNYILDPENWLYQSAGDTMLGLRCYFTFGSGVSQIVRARAVFHNTDVVTDLETVDGSQCTMHDGKYVINGQFVIVREGKTYNAVGESINR